jgi:uncharacterized membrane protein
MQLLATRTQRVGARHQLVEITEHIEFVATRLFIPASLILLILGIWMVGLRWSFGQTWILLGIAMFLYSFLSVSLYLTPQMRRVKAWSRGTERSPRKSASSPIASSWERGSSWCS